LIGGSGPDQFNVGQSSARSATTRSMRAALGMSYVIYFDTRDYAAASISSSGVTTLSFDSGAQTMQINAVWLTNLVFEDRTVRM
jgi:hypothetical protein